MTETTKFGIKDLAKEDRPREKLLEKGLFSLTDAELIAILIGSGSPKESAVELAQKIMKHYQNNLVELGKATVEQLINNFYGVGEAKAITIVAAMELARRRSSTAAVEMPQIITSRDIFDLMFPLLSDLNHEEFWILLLNNNNKVKTRANIGKGGISKTIVDVRLIFKKAIDVGASYIVLCHNHPSDSIKPSKDDIDLTKKLSEAGKILDIKVLDHVIISGRSYFSFADENMLK